MGIVIYGSRRNYLIKQFIREGGLLSSNRLENI